MPSPIFPLPVSIAELRIWLRLDVRAEEDSLLENLIATAADQCERYIGQRLMMGPCVDNVPADGQWHQLEYRPVHLINGVDLFDANNSARPLPAAHYEVNITKEAVGEVRAQVQAGNVVSVRYYAGLANGVSDVPPVLRQGILRLAAYHYATRDSSDALPDVVASLWQSFRKMKL